jgi:hypothetical protein
VPWATYRDCLKYKTLIISNLGINFIFAQRSLRCPDPFLPGNGTPIIPNTAKSAERIPLPAVSAHTIGSDCCQGEVQPNRGFPRCLECDVAPMELVDQLTEGFMGVTSQGRKTGKAPVRTEPHPTCAVVPLECHPAIELVDQRPGIHGRSRHTSG